LFTVHPIIKHQASSIKDSAITMAKSTSTSQSIQDALKRLNIIIGKFFAIGSKPNPTTFPELPDCVLWLRCTLAVGYGIYLGARPGAVNLLFGLNVVTFLPIMYCQLLLLADMDSYTEPTSLHFVGVVQAVGIVMLVWIFGFTQAHAAEEAKLVAAMIVQQVVAGASNTDPDDFDAAATSTGASAAAASEQAAGATPVEPESEF
jgi:hypothetical protein